MKRVMVTYKIATNFIDQNETMIRAVFSELHALGPSDVRYSTMSDADGGFLHILESANPEFQLSHLHAFKAFVADIRDRCIEMPVLREMTLLDVYPATAAMK